MLDKILNAKSVAIIGASKVKTKRGFQAVHTLLENNYEGRIYPINPKETKIHGLKCYSTISDIKRPIDLVLITTPAKTLPSILEECGKKQVSGAVIIAGGFGELGSEGKKLEYEIVGIARKYNMRLIGPNTSGMINLKSGLNLVGLQNAPKGEIALLTQSGNIALTLITEANLKSQKGFSYYVGVGNEADIKFHEYLEFLGEDPDTNVILMYVEGMREGRKFMQQAYKTTLQKPIVLLKSGRSITGQRSAGSHTGALAGLSEVSISAFQRAGITVIENPDDLFPVAETLSSLPKIKNNSIAILADGGGHATIAADLLTDLNVKMPDLHPKTIKKLREILPASASVANPVDVAGGTDSNPGLFADCAQILLRDHNIGGLLIVGLFGGYGLRFAEGLTLMEEDAAHRMGKMVRDGKKPIIVHSLYSSVKTHPLKLLQYYNIPVNDSLSVSCKCISALAQYGSYLKSYHAKANYEFNWRAKAKPEGVEIIEVSKKEGRNALLEHEAKRLFKIHGAPVSEDVFVQTADEACQVLNGIKGGVALKIVSPDILHKSDAGGVYLNLTSKDSIKKSFNMINKNAKQYNPEADIRGVIVSPMAKKGLEVIIGTKIDDQFGPVIMYGLGGIMVEVMRDVSFRVLPISPNSAKKMMRETRSYPLLEGFRGGASYDKKAIEKLLLTCSEVVEAYPEIEEIDLNPVIINEEGVTVVDARVILKA